MKKVSSKNIMKNWEDQWKELWSAQEIGGIGWEEGLVFIRQVRAEAVKEARLQERAEIIKEIEGMRKNKPLFVAYDADSEEYNQAIDDIISKLKQKEKGEV
jgi:uncharacterized protein YbcI